MGERNASGDPGEYWGWGGTGWNRSRKHKQPGDRGRWRNGSGAQASVSQRQPCLPASRAGQGRAAAGSEQAGTWWLQWPWERDWTNWQSAETEMPFSGDLRGKCWRKGSSHRQRRRSPDYPGRNETVPEQYLRRPCGRWKRRGAHLPGSRAGGGRSGRTRNGGVRTPAFPNPSGDRWPGKRPIPG